MSHEMIHRMFLQSKKAPEGREILLMLCDLQDCGLIELTSNKKLSDVTFYDYGIKIHEQLHFLQGDDEFKR